MGKRGPKARSLTDRFMEKVLVIEGGCWLWQGGTVTHNGYGQIYVEGKMRRAHRVGYELFAGPIPDGKQLNHLCRTRLCVYHEHLEVVTLEENLRAGNGPRDTRIRFQARTHCKKGHELTPENIYTYLKDGYKCHQCRVCQRANARRHYYVTV